MYYKSSLRQDRCALRGAFLRWMLFNAALMVGSFLAFLFFYFIMSSGGRAPESLSRKLDVAWPTLLAPEDVVLCIAHKLAPLPPNQTLMRMFVIYFVLPWLRLGVIFAWGVSRLRRGKYAPYAETLCLLGGCVFIAGWLGRVLRFDHLAFQVYLIGALMLIAGIVVYILQRRHPPAWKWKTPG